MNPKPTYYDATLATEQDGLLGLDYNGRRLELPGFPGPVFAGRVGQVGVASWAFEGKCYRFEAYLDQSLRRLPELDHGDRIGWTNATKPHGWTAPRDILPGVNGAFLENETEAVSIDIPPEFWNLADHYGQDPVSILRGFIADACGLKNAVGNPRCDHYSSNGSDERRLAGDYLDRAYGMFVDPAQAGWTVAVTPTEGGQWRWGVLDPAGVEVVGGGGYDDEDEARGDGQAELAAQTQPGAVVV